MNSTQKKMSKPKHSVDEVEEFMGYPKLLELIESCKNIRDKCLIAIMFLTGSRISEVLQFNDKHFDLKSYGDFVFCDKIPIVKQTKIHNKHRSIFFLKKEPAYKYFEEYYLFITSKKHHLRFRNLFDITRQQAFNIVRDAGRKANIIMWNHRLRSERASNLGSDYDFTENELLEYFNVKDRDWARRYCKKGKRKLGFKMLQQFQINTPTLKP